MEIPFIGGAYLGRSKDINAQTCINLYPVVDQHGGKNVSALIGTPGHSSFCASGHTAQVRRIHPVGTTLFAIIGNRIYSVDTDGNATQITGTLTNSTGFIIIADNGLELMIVEPGVAGYLYRIVDSATFSADDSTDVITSAGHGLSNGSTIQFTTTDTLPAGLSLATTHYVISASTDTFKVSATLGGSAVDITDTGTGTHTFEPVVAEVADTDFPTPYGLCFLDGYFIVTENGTGKFYISSLLDGVNWDASDVATAQQYPDNLAQCIPDKSGQLVLVGEKSNEFWFNTGAAAFPFEHVDGSTLKEGTPAPASVATDQTFLYFLNNYKQVRAISGYQAQNISTPAIEYQISTYSVISDAFGFCYTQEGHNFYVLTFPTEAKTWVYDATTGLWHQRESYVVSVPGGSEIQSYRGRHRANCYAFFNNKHYIGDYEDGNLYEYDLDVYTENSITFRWERAAQVIHKDRKTLFFPELEVDFESGVGLATGQGNDPQVALDWSDDGGRNWKNELWRSIGKIGKYEARAKWNRLGSSKNRVFRLHGSDPVKRVIINAHARIVVGDS